MRDKHEACRGCYWYDSCTDSRPCDYYYPVLDEYAQVKEDMAQTQERREFYDEYMEYVKDWD